ncbi:tetratricopeptide repeat protein [Wielerella bovis]|uniref:tetratricopeptide repeat protein n=1 Tax=Wielerella bovis TaxID=2917790 RepID=UPI002018B2D2|nr:tetratricopeptide repeat protein [Wielerella bovis]ULJ69845.1 tetratricopeptide repeat protein [Wielerella bovis]
MKSLLFSLFIASSLTACVAIPSSPNNQQPETASTPAVAESEQTPLPYPDLNSMADQREQFEQLAIQVVRLEQQVEQLQMRVHQLEQRSHSAPRNTPRPRMASKPETMPVSGSLKNVTHPSAQNLLHQAQMQFKQGNYRATATILHDADSGGDGSEIARQSMYLLLQSQQKLGNCQSVINIGQRYASRFASSTFAADALYAVGDCQWKIQQQDIAKDTWRNLIRLYPNSLAARRSAIHLK